LYSFPNIIFPLFGGYIIDLLGVRIGIVVFSGLVCLGQTLFGFGVFLRSYGIALGGRVVFGLGGESLNVSQSTLVASWFGGKELAMALGMNISISRLGSVLNNMTEPLLYHLTDSVVFGLFFGLGVCSVSLVCGVLLSLIDRYRDAKLGIKAKKKLDPSERVKFSDVKRFGLSFWLIAVNCLVVYVCVMSFNNIAGKFFQERFGFSLTTADYIMSITYGIAGIACPVFGFVVDKTGKRGHLIIASSVFMFLVHFVYLLMPDCKECFYAPFPLGLLGIGYSIYASVMWASVPLVVEARTVGTAFGVVTATQNLGLAVAPMLVGKIHDSSSGGYFWVSLLFMSFGVVGVVTAVWLNAVEGTRILNSSSPKLGIEKLLEEGVGYDELESSALRASFVKRSFVSK